MNTRVVGVFTGNRAEYGLQYPILRAIASHPRLEYRLLASGAHLDPLFGETRQEIKADGFEVHAEIEMSIDRDDLYATVQAIGAGIMAIGQELWRLRPDVFVVYADRFEGLAAAVASTQMGIPTAHIEGGDLTEGGALDDSVRHAMTKLAHLHFTTNQQASNRILAMGEEPWRVHTVGFPTIDLVKDALFAPRDQIVKRFDLDVNRPIVLFTQHSVTTEYHLAGDQIRPSLKAIERIARNDGAQVVITYPNNDAGGRRIIEELRAFAVAGVPNVQLHESLGRYVYHGLMALAKDPSVRIGCVGNSSSGIKETPAFGCPVVNIGSRQQGRLRTTNVLDVDYDAEAIYIAVKRCLEDGSFRASCRSCDNPYGQGDAGPKIADVLAAVPLDHRLLRKRMTLKGEVRDGWFR